MTRPHDPRLDTASAVHTVLAGRCSTSTCPGRRRSRRLIHTFETDIVAITLPGVAGAPLESALAAIVAGASDALEGPIEDIGGTLRMSGDRRQVVIYDTVPGGAGNAMRIAVDFERVVSEAIKRVKDCGCGIYAACYACLKNHQNQRHHERLSRRDALARLEPLLVDQRAVKPASRSAEPSLPERLPLTWQDAADQADPSVHVLLRELEVAMAPLPEIGTEIGEEAVVAELSWPGPRVAVVLPEESGRGEDPEESRMARVHLG